VASKESHDGKTYLSTSLDITSNDSTRCEGLWDSIGLHHILSRDVYIPLTAMVLFHIFQYFSSENATDEDFLSSDLEPFDEMSDSTNKSHATGGSIVPETAQEKLPKGVEQSVPDSVHDTNSSVSHATGESMVPEEIQKIAPASLEKALPESIHPTEGSSIDK